MQPGQTRKNIFAGHTVKLFLGSGPLMRHPLSGQMFDLFKQRLSPKIVLGGQVILFMFCEPARIQDCLFLSFGLLAARAKQAKSAVGLTSPFHVPPCCVFFCCHGRKLCFVEGANSRSLTPCYTRECEAGRAGNSKEASEIARARLHIDACSSERQ